MHHEISINGSCNSSRPLHTENGSKETLMYTIYDGKILHRFSTYPNINHGKDLENVIKTHSRYHPLIPLAKWDVNGILRVQ